MSFMFYGPKKENEVEEEDNKFFFSVSEGKDEESFLKWRKREVVSIGGK